MPFWIEHLEITSGGDGRLAKSTLYFNVTMTLVVICALKGCNAL